MRSLLVVTWWRLALRAVGVDLLPRIAILLKHRAATTHTETETLPTIERATARACAYVTVLMSLLGVPL